MNKEKADINLKHSAGVVSRMTISLFIIIPQNRDWHFIEIVICAEYHTYLMGGGGTGMTGEGG